MSEEKIISGPRLKAIMMLQAIVSIQFFANIVLLIYYWSSLSTHMLIAYIFIFGFLTRALWNLLKSIPGHKYTDIYAAIRPPREIDETPDGIRDFYGQIASYYVVFSWFYGLLYFYDPSLNISIIMYVLIAVIGMFVASILIGGGINMLMYFLSRNKYLTLTLFGGIISSVLTFHSVEYVYLFFS